MCKWVEEAKRPNTKAEAYSIMDTLKPGEGMVLFTERPTGLHRSQVWDLINRAVSLMNKGKVVICSRRITDSTATRVGTFEYFVLACE